MNPSRGIFENFPSQGGSSPSPFAAAEEPAATPSPFAPAGDSPFSISTDQNGSRVETGKPARLPEKRKADSPFQIADAQEGFGFEPPVQANPFQAAQPAGGSPFSMAQPPRAAEPAPAQAFGGWPPVAAVQAQAVAEQAAAPAPAYQAPQPQQAYQAPQVQAVPQEASQNDSYSIRQLELRAIFGVDREMNHEEILQRSRALPGIRQVSVVPEKDMAAVETLKGMLNTLGFGGGALKLYAGSVPIEFIREGKVLLAVQSDGGFAPGVRETLMIVARELGHRA